jgi:UDP:flavonoid glycosyltransferase YjiC (YdhE family)
MRALFTVQPAIGHLHPLLPVAAAVRDAGHDIAICSSRSFRGEVERYGFEYLPAGLDWVTSDRTTWSAFPPMPRPGTPEFPHFVVTVFFDVTTTAMVPDLLALAEDWRPDLIVRESMELGGAIVAERLGIPHASVGGNAYSGIDSPEVNYFPGNRRLIAEPVARHREVAGLLPDPDIEMPFRHLHLCFTPPHWDRPGAPAPRNTRHFRYAALARPGERLPAWADELSGRPTLLAAFGTIAQATPGLLEAVLGGLADEHANLIVSIGPGQDPARFGPMPENVHLEPYVPQTLLLPQCDVLVTHGGFNSVKEAVAAGVPLVVCPLMSDQPYSAERCEALGLGRVVGPETRTAEGIREAVRAVLADSTYKARVEAFRDELLALPGPDAIVTALEALAAERVAV